MKLWPTRSKAENKEDVEPITDLDAIIAEPVSFRYKGKVHILKPMHLDEFLKFTNAQARLLNSVDKDDVALNPRELAKRYHQVLSAVCDTITVDDILEMEQVQVAALYQLVIDVVTGQVKDGTEKKSRQKIPLYESVQALSSPSVPENSGGH